MELCFRNINLIGRFLSIGEDFLSVLEIKGMTIGNDGLNCGGETE